MPNHYDIELILDGENVVPGPVPDLIVGDTVEYFSESGSVLVNFPDGSPFQTPSIGDRQKVTVQNEGNFRGNCFVFKNGQRFGWKSDPSPSGVDHKIPPPKKDA